MPMALVSSHSMILWVVGEALLAQLEGVIDLDIALEEHELGELLELRV